jgi:hypothetical protein
MSQSSVCLSHRAKSASSISQFLPSTERILHPVSSPTVVLTIAGLLHPSGLCLQYADAKAPIPGKITRDRCRDAQDVGRITDLIRAETA